MRLHPNARLTPLARHLLVDRVETEGWPVARAARAAGVSRQTAYKWLHRFRERSDTLLHATSVADIIRAKSEGKKLGRPEGSTKVKVKHQDEIVSLRDVGMSIRKIAGALKVSTSTVQMALKRTM